MIGINDCQCLVGDLVVLLDHALEGVAVHRQQKEWVRLALRRRRRRGNELDEEIKWILRRNVSQTTTMIGFLSRPVMLRSLSDIESARASPSVTLPHRTTGESAAFITEIAPTKRLHPPRISVAIRTRTPTGMPGPQTSCPPDLSLLGGAVPP